MEMVKYGVNEASISKMADIYLNLSIDGIDDKDGYNDVHSARMVIVKHRTSIDKLRKITNKDAQEFINNNNKNSKKLLSLIAPIEEHLKSEENKITQEKKRIQEEKERIEQEIVNKRVYALLNIEVIMPHTEVAVMTDDEYESLFKNAKKIFDDKKAKADEEKRLIAELEKKLAIERADIERIRLEQEKIAKAQADKDREIEEIKQERIIAEKIEKERIEKEKAESIEKKRIEEIKPDKEKILQYAKRLTSIIGPDLKNSNAISIILFAESELNNIAENIIKQSEKL